MTLPPRITTALCLVGLLALTGCVLPDDVAQMQKDLADVRAQLISVQREQEETARQMQALEGLAAQQAEGEERLTRTDLAEFGIRVERIDRNLGIVDEQLNDLFGRVERMSDDVDHTRDLARRSSAIGVGEPRAEPQGPTALLGHPAGPPVGGPEAEPAPEELYKTAYADFSKGNYALAIAGFEEFYERFPTSAQADNALYWVGECSFSQGDYRQAIKHLDRMLELFPGSDKAAAANLKKGLSYLEQNLVGQATVQLQLVSTQYAGTDEAKIAREKLQSLGAPI